MQCGANMNWVAMIRAVTLPSAATTGAEILFGELTGEMKGFRIDALDIARRVDVLRKRGEHDHAEQYRHQNADAERPQQLSPENAALMRGMMRLAHRSAHDAARQKDQQINSEVTEHQQCNRAAGEYARAERHDAHDFGQRRLINLIDGFQRSVYGGGFCHRHLRRLASAV